ncbi:hypothetical protein KY289_019477 [Solanum tuberosum]|nr:hypothetical protein KY284_019254 [Solanum tuberosum]KAH0681725.1 hypothetical protein KY289_019477 [Solanum tuberosum]
MKIFVKTLKGSHFEIEVKPEDTVHSELGDVECFEIVLQCWCCLVICFFKEAILLLEDASMEV